MRNRPKLSKRFVTILLLIIVGSGALVLYPWINLAVEASRQAEQSEKPASDRAPLE